MTVLDIRNREITLGYSGGSGGFFILHQILNSMHHWCAFLHIGDGKYSNSRPAPPQTYADFFDIFRSARTNQWSMPSTMHKIWKDLETWPDNNVTARHDIKNKHRLFYVCNPSALADNSVYVYTSIKTHAVLQLYKSANLAYCFARPEEVEWRSWLYDETYKIDNYYTSSTLAKMIESKEATLNSTLNKWVQKDVNEFVNANPYVHFIDLKDALKNECRGLCEMLNIRYTPAHQKLYYHWLSLHPPFIQEMLLSDDPN